MNDKQNRSVKNDFKTLIQKYHLKRMKNPVRSKMTVCPWNGFSCNDEDCICDHGKYEARSPWTNATSVWTGIVNDRLVLVMFFYPFSWFSVDVFAKGIKEIQLDDFLEMKNHPIHRATTSHWDGEVAGSAIPRHPKNLRGFMYRGLYNGKDGHFLPKGDIVEYLLKRLHK